MGLKTRGGLSRADYRAARRCQADENAQPPMTREQNEEARRKRAQELALAEKPKHNTTHGTYTGPIDKGTTAPPPAPETTGAYRVEYKPTTQTDSVTGETRTVTVREHVPIRAAAAAGAAVALGVIESRADDGAKPWQRPAAPRGKPRNVKHDRNKKPGRPNRK